MRGVKRTPAPSEANLSSYQQSNAKWEDLADRQTQQAKDDYHALRSKLHREFSGLCAYCERKVPQGGQPGPLDHFRPRNPSTGSQQSHFGTDLTFEWLNLMYACPQCQTNKDNKWPGTLSTHREALINAFLTTAAVGEGWTYVPVLANTGYVDPNINSGDATEHCFTYSATDCTIFASPLLPDDQRSKARRTIHDIKLDDSELARERGAHIEEIMQHVNGVGRRRKLQAIARLMTKHERRSLEDTRPGAYEPAARFTGLILFAFQNDWFQ